MSKQYLLACDEQGLRSLMAVFPNTIQFLEVQGVNLDQESRVQLLATPINPPAPPVVDSAPVEEKSVE